MLEPIRDYFVKDGIVMKVSKFEPSWTKGKKTVYEVMRIMNGLPLFAEEHTDRLLQSASLADIKGVISPDLIHDNIGKLLHANAVDDGNILFCLLSVKAKVHFLAWFVPHYYPTKGEYDNGIIVRSLKAIRENPNAKIWNTILRKQAENLKESSGAYEILLVDKKNNVTEGSKSNIFFIRGNTVFTAPESRVLSGITRVKIKKLCNHLTIRFTETEIPIKEISFYESAFLSGTSPGILPIRIIDKVGFNCANKNLRTLMQAYDAMIDG